MTDRGFVKQAAPGTRPARQQSASQAADGAAHSCGAVGLERWEADDIRGKQPGRDMKLSFADTLQRGQWVLWVEEHQARLPAAAGMPVRDAARTQERRIAIQILALEGADDRATWLDAHPIPVAGIVERPGHTFQLPGRRVGRRKGEMPALVEHERRRSRSVEAHVQACQLEQLSIILYYRRWRRAQDRDPGAVDHEPNSSASCCA